MHSLPCVMMIVVAGALLSTGCPPPPLELDEPDAAPNATPGILSVRNETGAEFAIGAAENPVIISGVDPSPSLMRLTLVDADVDDTLYVRAFNNYNDVPPAQPARAVCNVSPSTEPTATRTVTCSLNSFCTAPGAVRMDVVVSDRQPDDAGVLVPPWYAVEDPGLQATRVYEVTCQDPT